MFGLIRKLISILFILALYFIIITFFSPIKAYKNNTEISFDKLFIENPTEKLNKIFSYQFQFLRDFQTNQQSKEFDKFLSNMFDSSIELSSLLLEITKLKNIYFLKEELDYLNRFFNEIQFLYQQFVNDCNLEKALCIKILLQESKNKLENLSTTDDQMQFQNLP